MAEQLAKKDTRLLQFKTMMNRSLDKAKIKRKTPEFFHNAKTIFNSSLQNDIEKTWQVNKYKPRKEAVALFYLNTEDDFLGEYLHHGFCLVYTMPQNKFSDQCEPFMLWNRLNTERRSSKNIRTLYQATRGLIYKCCHKKQTIYQKMVLLKYCSFKVFQFKT